jgi:hypothetical protein
MKRSTAADVSAWLAAGAFDARAFDAVVDADFGCAGFAPAPFAGAVRGADGADRAPAAADGLFFAARSGFDFGCGFRAIR